MSAYSIVYQAEVSFPTNDDTFNLNAKPAVKGQRILNKTFIADPTGSNYRYISFLNSSGDDVLVEIEGTTIFNQFIKETLNLQDATPTLSVNLYKNFTVTPLDNITSLSIGYGLGMSEIIAYDGTPTSHRVIVNGGGGVNYTVYGLLTNKTLTKTELDAQKFAISSDLSGETASTPTIVFVNAPATKVFLEVSTLGEATSVDWKFNTQSLL